MDFCQGLRAPGYVFVMPIIDYCRRFLSISWKCRSKKMMGAWSKDPARTILHKTDNSQLHNFGASSNKTC